MFRRALPLVFVVGLAGLVGCGQHVEGSGKAATEDREVGEVTEVSLTGIGDLVVVPGEKTRLVVTADDNILPLIATTSEGGKLSIGMKPGFNPRPRVPVTFTLFVKSLDKLTVSGAGNAAGEGLAGEKLEVRISGAGNVSMKGLTYKEVAASVSGAGDVELGGTTGKFTASISGAGDIDAKELKADSAEVSVSGAGDASVWATDDLKVRVSGAGDVRYKGSPKVEQKVSGAGDVKPMK